MIESQFDLEEYRHINQTITELDRRLSNIVIGICTIIPAIISFAFKFSFTSDIDKDVNFSYGEMATYFYFALQLILTILFDYLYSIRKEIAKFGMYRLVFFEEIYNNKKGWESRLKKFRMKNKGETFDNLPLIIFVLNFILICGFAFTNYNALIARKIPNLIIAAFIILFSSINIFIYFKKWKYLIPYELEKIYSDWKCIYLEEEANHKDS